MPRPRWCTKLWLTLCLAPLAVLSSSACKSKPKPIDLPPDVAAVTVDVRESILIDEGASSQPSFSPAGDRLLFVSAQRVGHTHPQVYERDLGPGLERRITFQSGATFAPRYHPRDKLILYSSSTDELKEAPPLLQPPQDPGQLPSAFAEPVEIYTHSLDELEITRVTTRPGFDGQARFAQDGRSVTWTTATRSQLTVVSLPYPTPAGARPRPLTGVPENSSSYTRSPNGKAASWIEWDKTFAISRLRLRRGQETVDVAGDLIVTKTDNEFTPDSKFLLWAQMDPQTNLHGIWAFDLESGCLEHFLFPSEGDRRHPTVSPDMKLLTYTLVSRGRSRIAQVPFKQRSGPCPNSP